MRSVQKNLYLLIILLISFPLNVLAQNKTITGTVRDANDVVIGASVTVKGQSSVGTITDMDGNYTLSIPASAKELTFSYIGYETQTVAIKGRTQINVTLKESSQMLEEVVAIGYAKVKRKDLTGSSVSVGANDLKMSPVSTAAQALAGKAAGVNIVQQSGAPGSEINITVRGGTSITQGTQPLYIVDGFQMENGLQNVDINDIESIDVMKDASATAIYGARGSNGVILITTKRGTSGKPTIRYNGYFGVEDFSHKLDFCDGSQITQRYRDYVSQNPGETMYNDYVKNAYEAENPPSDAKRTAEDQKADSQDPAAGRELSGFSCR